MNEFTEKELEWIFDVSADYTRRMYPFLYIAAAEIEARIAPRERGTAELLKTLDTVEMVEDVCRKCALKISGDEQEVVAKKAEEIQQLKDEYRERIESLLNKAKNDETAKQN